MVEHVLKVENLTKIYHSRRRGDIKAVNNVSFSIRKNEVVGLLGPNGAGKTTTIKSICTILRPTSGQIWIDGVDAIRHPTRALEKVAAVLEGNRNIYWRLNARDNLQFFAALQGIPLRKVKSHIDELIELFNLKEKVNEQARTLSRGMQQKLAVACALVKQTPILLLDEPTLGLDVETSHELRWILKKMAERGERTILLSSHDMNVVQDICERVIIIHQGRVVTDNKVSNLLELFKARAYKFTIEGSLSEGQQLRLKGRFELIKIQNGAHESSIEVELLQNGQIYDLIDILRENGSRIESIDRQDPNMEEIFLKIVRGEKK